MNKNKYILPDSELVDLSELAPLTEGATLEDFLDEAQHVAAAIEKVGVDISRLKPKARALLFMRGFYFLGVLRGGEAYRASLLLNDDPNADELPPIPFELSESCTDLFVQDVQGKPSETLRAIYKTAGLC